MRLGTDNAKPSNVGQYAHCEITICHPAMDLELLQVRSRVQFHALNDGMGLESVRLKGFTSNMWGVSVPVKEAKIIFKGNEKIDGPMNIPVAPGSQ